MVQAIDIICNLFTPTEVENDQTGLDDTFKAQVRMARADWGGVEMDDYIRRMDEAGIERSFLAAVRCGDMNIKGSYEISYERVAEVCAKYPDRFSGLAGLDPTRGMQGLRDLDMAVKDYGFIGAHFYPHWFGLAPDHAKWYPYYAKCCELDIPVMLQVGHNLVYSRERRLPSVGRPIALDQVAIGWLGCANQARNDFSRRTPQRCLRSFSGAAPMATGPTPVAKSPRAAPALVSRKLR